MYRTMAHTLPKCDTLVNCVLSRDLTQHRQTFIMGTDATLRFMALALVTLFISNLRCVNGASTQQWLCALLEVA